jgi:hypothetical protein
MEARAGIELIKYNYIFQYDKLGSLRSTINLTITLGFHLGSILNDESNDFTPICGPIRALKCLAFLTAAKEPISHFDGSNCGGVRADFRPPFSVNEGCECSCPSSDEITLP